MTTFAERSDEMCNKEALDSIDNYWIRTDVGHVWYNTKSEDYMFSDEAEQFNGPFSTKEEAKKQLFYYISTYL